MISTRYVLLFLLFLNIVLVLIICSYQNYEVTVYVKFSVNKKIQLHCEGRLYENIHHQNIDLQANIGHWVKINGSYMGKGVISV